MARHLPALCLLTSLLALGACSDVPDSSFASRGQPESLLDVSVETLTIPLDNAKGLDDLVSYINRASPTQASVQCAGNDMLCRNAHRILADFHVPYAEQPSAANQVVLTYQRIIARDCDPRYVDNSINPYNLNHPAFGCANAANMVQQVSDQRQFLDPALLGPADGSKTRQVYKDYMKPAENKKSESQLSGVKQQ